MVIMVTIYMRDHGYNIQNIYLLYYKGYKCNDGYNTNFSYNVHNIYMLYYKGYKCNHDYNNFSCNGHNINMSMDTTLCDPDFNVFIYKCDHDYNVYKTTIIMIIKSIIT